MGKRYRVDSPEFDGIDDMLNRQHVDVLGRLESPLLASPCVRTGEDVAFGQIEKELVEKADRNFKLVRYLPGGQGRFPPGEVLDEALRDLQGKQRLEAAAGL